MKKINWKKIIEILITAILSAGIAILQNVLMQYLGNDNTQVNPESAGLIGGAISYARKFLI